MYERTRQNNYVVSHVTSDEYKNIGACFLD